MIENIAVTFAATLADEFARQGITDVVVCPGSRSTPIAVAVAEHAGLRVHVHHDERSAAFMALGLAMATGVPAPVITTSGTAAVELHPAVVEAHHSCVPFLAVTADRPPELHGVCAPQTIDQEHLYGDAVRWFASPGPPTPESRPLWRHLAADAVASTKGIRPGPVHLNLAFREPLLGGCGELPPHSAETDRPPTPVWGVPDEAFGDLLPLLAQNGVIVCGVRAVESVEDLDAILSLAEVLGWPVLPDHLSGARVVHPSLVTTFDPALRVAEVAEALCPSTVLRIGGLLASRIANEWLAASGAVQIGLDRHGVWPDPDHVLAHRLRAPIAHTCTTLGQLMEGRDVRADASWLAGWSEVERASRSAIDAEVVVQGGEIGVVTSVLAALPEGAALVVSSSMPIRDLEWYVPARIGVRVLSNRGANGIDGVVSTAVGVALSGCPTALVIGDVAFLHDINGLLGLAARGADLLIVVVDNDGGGIFSFLPQADQLEPARFEQLFGTPHGLDLVAVAAAHGVPAMRCAGSGDDLMAMVADRVGSGGVSVMVIGSDRSENRAAHAAVNESVASALRSIPPAAGAGHLT